MNKVGVFILNYKRPDTIEKVINSALNQTAKPEVIVIWNNNPTISVNFSGCLNINSQENFKCIIRHTAALARSDIDYWVFVDDDVQMKPRTVENFLAYSKKYPESILGHYGRDIVKPPALYSLDSSNFFTNQEREVDIVLGMIHFCHRDKLANSFMLKKKIKDLPLTEDDIILSLSNKYLDGAKNYVIPYGTDAGTIPLASKHGGLSHQPGHFAKRKDAVQRILTWAGELPKEVEKSEPSKGEMREL